MRLMALSCAAAMAAIVMQGEARAQSVIGQAAQSAPLVTGAVGSRNVTISAGDSVHQNELIQTSALGQTLLQFADSTHLSVGSSASVRLDRYVYNPDATARQAVLSMTQGAFRFATGFSNPGAFKLQTPHAVIGIRGTIVEFEVTRAISHITLLKGAITVCPRVRTRACMEVVTPGHTVSVDAGGVIRSERIPPTGPDIIRERGEGGGGDGGGGGGGGSGGGRGR